MASKVVYIKNGNPVIQDIRATFNTHSNSFNPGAGFSIPKYGLWCPWGKDGIDEAKRRTTEEVRYPAASWTFLVEDEKRYLLAKIKYGI